MASTLVWKIATFTSAATLGPTLTDQQNAQIVQWYMADKISPPDPALPQAQVSQYYLDAALVEVVNHIRRDARKNRLAFLRSQQADLEAQAAAETAI